MKILALEFSSELRSVAVGDSAAGPSILASASERGGRATRALGLIETVLEQAAIERSVIEVVAVGIGPGSYTGIRAALALAQGWQLARPVHVLGISSAECVAAAAQAQGTRGVVTVVIDAQRGDFYAASFELTDDQIRPRQRLRIVSGSEVSGFDSGTLIGPDVLRTGSEGRTVLPEAATLLRLAAGRRDFVDPAALEPIYLREIAFVKAPPPRQLPSTARL